MADDADRSDARIQNAIEDGIAAVRRNIGKSLLPCGVCHWCGSTVSVSQLFCPEDSCAEDWQHEQDCKRIQGR